MRRSYRKYGLLLASASATRNSVLIGAAMESAAAAAMFARGSRGGEIDGLDDDDEQCLPPLCSPHIKSRTQEDAGAAPHEHTNACTLLRLLDAHLLPEFLYTVAVGRTAAIPVFCGLPACNFIRAICVSRGPLTICCRPTMPAPTHSEKRCQAPSWRHSRFQSRRLERDGRQRETAQRRMTSASRAGDPPARSRTVFPVSVNLYSRM